MSIQQALFAGSSSNWTLVNTDSYDTTGNSVSLPDTQIGDIILAFLGNPGENNPVPSSSGDFSEIQRRQVGDVNYGVFAAVATVAGTNFDIRSEFDDYRYAFFCAFRTSSAFTNTSSVLWKKETDNNSGDPITHNDSSSTFGMNSLALQVAWTKQTIGTTWMPPENTTVWNANEYSDLVGSDNDSGGNGSVAVASWEINQAGTYKWENWGPTDASSANDWVTGYVEVQQP